MQIGLWIKCTHSNDPGEGSINIQWWLSSAQLMADNRTSVLAGHRWEMVYFHFWGEWMCFFALPPLADMLPVATEKWHLKSIRKPIKCFCRLLLNFVLLLSAHCWNSCDCFLRPASRRPGYWHLGACSDATEHGWRLEWLHMPVLPHSGHFQSELFHYISEESTRCTQQSKWPTKCGNTRANPAFKCLSEKSKTFISPSQCLIFCVCKWSILCPVIHQQAGLKDVVANVVRPLLSARQLVLL